MRGRWAWIALIGAAAFAAGDAALAQTRREPTRGYVGVSVGALVSSSTVTAPLTFPVYGETARIEIEASWPAGGTVEFDGGVRLWRDFGVALTVGHGRRDGDATLSGTIPHPYFFMQTRPLDAAGPSLARTETATHIGLMWRRRVSRRVTVAAIAGPSVIVVAQDVITGVSWTESYPYTSVTLTRPAVARRDGSATGFHVAGDVVVSLAPQVGLVGGLRYSRASVVLESVPGQQVEVDLGGVVVRGGVRWLF